MRWPNITGLYEPMLRATDVFDISTKKRWDDLHTRVIEHVSKLQDGFSNHSLNAMNRIFVLLQNTIPE